MGAKKRPPLCKEMIQWSLSWGRQVVLFLGPALSTKCARKRAQNGVRLFESFALVPIRSRVIRSPGIKRPRLKDHLFLNRCTHEIDTALLFRLPSGAPVATGSTVFRIKYFRTIVVLGATLFWSLYV